MLHVNKAQKKKKGLLARISFELNMRERGEEEACDRVVVEVVRSYRKILAWNSL